MVSRPERPLLYAHRGASLECPENTLVSFRRALDIGIDVIETDAHMSADGHVVLSHDPSGGRMCGVPKEIRHCTLREVESWDAGRGFVTAEGERPFAGGDCRIPPLAEVLRALPDTPLNIDVKQSEPSMVGAIVSLLRDAGAAERVTLASFSHHTMRAIRELGYEGPTALAQRELATALAVPRALRRLRPIRANAAQIPVRVGRLDLSAPRVVAKLHALGLRVDYWTINDPAEANRLLDAGADGIMTDDPRAIAPVFAARRT